MSTAMVARPNIASTTHDRRTNDRRRAGSLAIRIRRAACSLGGACFTCWLREARCSDLGLATPATGPGLTRRASKSLTSWRKLGVSAEPFQSAKSSAWIPRNPSGGLTCSIRTGNSLCWDRATSASSRTHWLAIEFFDHNTKTHGVASIASSIATFHVIPVAIFVSCQTDQPNDSSSPASLTATAPSSRA